MLGLGLGLLLAAGAARAEPPGSGSGPGVVVVPGGGGGTGVVVQGGGGGTGVVVQGRVPSRRGPGPVVWWSVYDTGAPPPPAGSPTQDLEPKPAGRLRLVVDPPDAQVWVDGNPLPPGGDASVGLLTGTYTVQAARPGYRSASREVVIERARTALLEIRLEPESP
jgi:hypothetical protein